MGARPVVLVGALKTGGKGEAGVGVGGGVGGRWGALDPYVRLSGKSIRLACLAVSWPNLRHFRGAR